MSDDFRGIWEHLESLRRLTDPLSDFRRNINPLPELYGKEGLESDTLSFLRAEEERRKSALGGLDTVKMELIAQEAERHRKLIEGPMEEARRQGLLDPNSEIRRCMASASESHEAFSQQFRAALPDELNKLTMGADLGGLANNYFSYPHSLLTLQTAMAEMQSPWLNINQLDQSVRAFAQIQAIGKEVNQGEPFAARLADALRPSLGDWRDEIKWNRELLENRPFRIDLYRKQGFDQRLTEFTVSAFDESMGIAGLREGSDVDRTVHEEPLDEEPGVVEASEEEVGFARARLAFDQLQRFEIALRRFIERVMQAYYGEQWMKRQLPSGVMDSWMTKRKAATSAGQPELSLIDYADFTDYRAIIERKDNWTQVFKSIFGRPEDVRESFQRLFPIRIATMHARIVTLDDELLLRVETKRVLRAIDLSG